MLFDTCIVESVTTDPSYLMLASETWILHTVSDIVKERTVVFLWRPPIDFLLQCTWFGFLFDNSGLRPKN